MARCVDCGTELQAVPRHRQLWCWKCKEYKVGTRVPRPKPYYQPEKPERTGRS